MYAIRLGRWSNAAGRFFLWDRIYSKGFKWTPFVRVRRRKRKTGIEKMREMLGVQGANGNWNYDPYMHGMYNGMEFMMSLAEGREPIFREAPEKWLSDIDTSGINPEVAS